MLKACADGGRKVTLINVRSPALALLRDSTRWITHYRKQMGRGDVVTEPELLHALENDWLDHAVLDVYVP